MEVLVGTERGLFRLVHPRDGRARPVPELAGAEVSWLSSDGEACWLIADRSTLWRGTGERWQPVLGIDDDLAARCVHSTSAGVLVGTSDARLLRVDPTTGASERLDGFDAAEGRERWTNPDGSPPDTRSLAQDDDGRLYANVHVGGILTSDDGGATWQPTSIEIGSDVHQVLATGDGPVLAATGRLGLCTTIDGGLTWTSTGDGLPLAHQDFGMENDHYCRAVAVCGDTVLLTASTGAFTNAAGIYRRELGSDQPFDKCIDGLPEWFDSNIDTGCLAGHGTTAVFGVSEGDVYVSDDEGLTWEAADRGLPPVRSVEIVPTGG